MPVSITDLQWKQVCVVSVNFGFLMTHLHHSSRTYILCAVNANSLRNVRNLRLKLTLNETSFIRFFIGGVTIPFSYTELFHWIIFLKEHKIETLKVFIIL